jgi:UDP-2-acetamido-2-deoxy-ribo-hexuluronate aminotransferase
MGEHRYQHPRIGINGRLDSIQAAVLTAKLSRYEWELDRRNQVAAGYTQAFADLKAHGVRTPYIKNDRGSVWAQYTLWVPDRTQFQAKLQEKSVPTAVHYPMAMPDQPAYKENGRIHDISNARQAAEHVVSLPMYPDMSPEVQEQVIKAVRGVYQ